MPPETSAATPGIPAASEIYDIGYRGYDGPRLGRVYATWSLFLASLRAAFGLGRPARAKIAPWGLAAIAIIPAGVSLAIAASVGAEFSPFSYDNYLWQMQAIFGLFVAAQAPELVGGDQRHRVLALYFSHALERLDYVIAKLGALVAALFIVMGAPMLVLFFGRILSATDLVAAFGDELGSVPQVLGAPLLHAIGVGAVALAIAAFTPRRAYATGAIIALFIVGSGIAEAVAFGTDGPLRDIGPLINPFVWLDGTRDWLLGSTVAESPVARSGLSLATYGLITLVAVLVSIGLTIWRYRRLGT
ncbi:MAG TPA: ABC transporter permease [Candidatus Limnocylindria bacterium]|nr:ABC transporter permease [Candidatus Limnocylindria bacterium]